MDTLGVHLVGLHHHLAVILASVHLLHVAQLQRAVVLERSLSVIERQQCRVFVPLDGVVRVADHAAVDERVPPGDRRDVFHRTNVCATYRGTEKEKRSSIKTFSGK